MRTIVITGGSDGIGAAAAEQLAGPGVRLVLVGRSPETTRSVAARVGAEHHLADFTRLDEVRALADALLERYPRIDVLANNAGGMFPGPERTEDGFEKTFQVNHLAPYLLTHQLISRLLESNATVVNTASIAARLYSRLDLEDLGAWGSFTPTRAYGNAKLANILFTKGLHERYHASGLSAVAFHPGVVATSFAAGADNYFRWLYHGAAARFLTSPQQGGATLAHFVTGQPGADWDSGEFYGSNRKPARTDRSAYDPWVIHEHWERSARLLGVHWPVGSRAS